MAMELFYNPDLMPEEEIRKTFVARQGLVDEIVSLIERQPDGAGVQHVVIIAPRGMGKTTVLLMIRLTMKDRGLAKRWQAVKFPEESYGIYDLADFWIEALNLLAADTADEELRKRAESLKTEYPDSDDLQEAALAVIKDWRRKHKKRLVLMVDNLDMILEQINDERDNARLRDVLMNDGTIMLLGCAVTFFHEARAYDQPLYNFFKIDELRNLKFDQMEELLHRRAEIDQIENFDAKLKANRGRLRVLEYFTGGNPRLVLMLYRVVVGSEISEVQRGLEKLLDEVTPYYKAKVESLPPQQRKILDHIARVSSETSEGLTPKQIAEATRLSVNQVSSQLKRLSDLGYIQSDNLRGRNSYYVLSERLYAIWHQMRFGRQARERMRWLVAFMKLWYDIEEMGTESVKLESRFHEFLGAGRMSEARDALEHRRYLAEAMPDSTARTSTMDGIVRGYLDLKETDILKKDILGDIVLEKLSLETLESLYEAGCITYEEAIASYDRAIEIKPDDNEAWHNRGYVLDSSGRYEEAIASYDRAIEIKPDYQIAWYNRGNTLVRLGRYEEALASYDRAIEIKPDYNKAWYNRSVVLNSLGRYEEAVASYDQVVKADESHFGYLDTRAHLMKFSIRARQGKLDLAKQDWAKAVQGFENLDEESWNSSVAPSLIYVAQIGHLEFVGQLIKESELEERLFPLARAIDYLLTGDEALIEKLSPEVRGVVEEIINNLRKNSGQAEQRKTKPKARKAKSGSRRRTRKQLS
jgi:tetratricopeptide (TPR) repeat protein